MVSFPEQLHWQADKEMSRAVKLIGNYRESGGQDGGQNYMAGNGVMSVKEIINRAGKRGYNQDCPYAYGNNGFKRKGGYRIYHGLVEA